jgi:hypothetical protein
VGGLRGRDGGGDLTNVQYKPIWNCHYESPLYNEYILIKFTKKEIKFYCVYIPHFLIDLSVVGHLGNFQSLAIVNSAAMNIGVQMSLLYPDLCSFG